MFTTWVVLPSTEAQSATGRRALNLLLFFTAGFYAFETIFIFPSPHVVFLLVLVFVLVSSIDLIISFGKVLNLVAVFAQLFGGYLEMRSLLTPLTPRLTSIF